MHPYDITASLKKLGKNNTILARELDVQPTVVGGVIRGKVSSYRVASYIAGLLGKPVSELWPEKYVFRPRTRARHRKPVALNTSSL